MVFPPEIPVWLTSWILGLFGLAFGSFFNVLIYRVPRELPIAFPASHCPLCQAPIRPWHNIPVLGWLMLGGRCKDFHARISIQYPLVELLCGLLAFGAVRLTQSDSNAMTDWALVLPMFWMVITLVPVAAVDFPYQLIPDTVSVGGLAIGLAVSFLPGGMGWFSSALGAVVSGGGLFVFAKIMGKLLKRDAMGFGDVKLLAALGAMLGWPHALAALIGASFGALLVMVPWRFFRKEAKDAPLAFGPFIAVMGPVMFLWGDSLMDAYWHLLGL